MADALIETATREVHELAMLLGFQECVTGLTEDEREIKLWERFRGYKAVRTTEERAAIHARFLALYLPDLVDAFLHSRAESRQGLANIFAATLFNLTINPNQYLAKFLLSDHPSAGGAKRLPAVWADLLVEQTVEAKGLLELLAGDRTSTGEAETSRKLVDTMYSFKTLGIWMSFHDDQQNSVPEPAKAGLFPFVRIVSLAPKVWNSAKGRSLDEVGKALAGNPAALVSLRAKRDAMEGLQGCGRSGCTEIYDLMQCASVAENTKKKTGEIPIYRTEQCATTRCGDRPEGGRIKHRVTDDVFQ